MARAVLAVEVDGLSVGYGGPPVLSDVSFAIPAGTCVGLIGPNGSGKSTLLKALLGLLPPAAGRVRVLGQPPRPGMAGVAYVPQSRALDRAFPVDVLDVVLMGRAGRRGLFRPYSAADHEAARRALERVDAWDLRHRPIGALSAGQLQRVLIARAVAQEPRLLLLDEPATGLDLPTQRAIFRLLDDLHGSGLTSISATHDLAGVRAHGFDMLLCLNRRLIACGPPAEALSQEVLAATFGTTFDVWRELVGPGAAAPPPAGAGPGAGPPNGRISAGERSLR